MRTREEIHVDYAGNSFQSDVIEVLLDIRELIREIKGDEE